MDKITETVNVEKLALDLLGDRRHGAVKAGAEELRKADEFSEGYKDFLNRSKTERETVSFAV